MTPKEQAEMEALLQRQRPLQPSAACWQAISAAVATKGRRNWRGLIARPSVPWAGMGLAACFGALFLGPFWQSGPEGDSAAAAGDSAPQAAVVVDSSEAMDVGVDPEKLLAENVLRQRIDDGIVFLKNGMPARRYRYEFLDRVVYRNAEDGSVVQLDVPREEVVYVPVQTF